MDGVERVWATIILEHVLFLCKLFVENIIPAEPTPAREAWEFQEKLKHQQLRYWGIEDVDSY
jgi:hypothetical protein